MPSLLLEGTWLLRDLHCKTAAMHRSITSGVPPASHLQPQRACHLWPWHPIPTGVSHKIIFPLESHFVICLVYFYQLKKIHTMTFSFSHAEKKGSQTGRKKGRKERGQNCPLSVVGSIYKIHSLRVYKGYFLSCVTLSLPGVCCLGDLRIFPSVLLHFFILFLIFKKNKYPIVHATSKYLLVMH